MSFLRRRPDDVDVTSFLANLGRLDAVRDSGLMDSPRSERLDAITRGAAEHFNAPMVFMSILDDRRVFHASAYETNPPPESSRSDSLEASYCQYVVALDEVLMINDSLTDDLVRDHPATVAGHVRSYLGVPIRSGEHCLGSFCVVDDQPRTWTRADVDALTTFAMDAMQAQPSTER